MTRHSSVRARQFVSFPLETRKRLSYLQGQFNHGWIATALRRVYLHPERVEEVLGLFEAMLFERENLRQGRFVITQAWEDYYKEVYRGWFSEKEQSEVARYLGPAPKDPVHGPATVFDMGV